MTDSPSSAALPWVVFVGLVGLTGLTVGVARVDLGALNTLVAMTIAGAKALLVLLYFMHLRYGGPRRRLALVAGILWLVLLIGLVVADVVSRGWLPGAGPPLG